MFILVARSKSTTRRDHIFLTNSYGFILIKLKESFNTQVA